MSNGYNRSLDEPDNSFRERQLAELARRDGEIGARVEQRVREMYGASSSMEGYHFRDSFDKESQASFQIDWVHQPRLRPIRFVYRHLPKSIRYVIKKFAR